jgi:hypothetical protein
MSEARDQLVEDARRILKYLEAGPPPLTGVLIETIERLVDMVENPWLSECDLHENRTFQCLGCIDKDLETIRNHLIELRFVHREIQIIGDLPGVAAGVSICIRCRERWPCETMAAVDGATEEIGQRFLEGATS